ncbi:MAG: golgi phosphoprotein 3 [Candidatus Cloacimonadota bacterium]|jgi:hypothetical protein|nr:golgi phosphoprotein 3 [Candidatus Cloacimonadota bacterium]
MKNKLTLPEELLLIALDDDEGTFVQMPMMALDYALAGALIMELALQERIGIRAGKLHLRNDSDLNDEIYNKLLQMIASESENKPVKFWIEKINFEFEDLKQTILQKLIDKKILMEKEEKILWVFHRRRYPMIHGEEEKEVKTRLREVVRQNKEPSTRDIILLSLIQACGLIDEVFSKEEQQKFSERIDSIAKLTTIGQEVHNEVQDFLEWYLMTQMEEDYYH